MLFGECGICDQGERKGMACICDDEPAPVEDNIMGGITENDELKDNDETPRQAVCPTALLSTALKSICLTRDYVGAETLPAIDGWEWYEAGKAIAKALPNDEWAIQFAIRSGFCPQCESPTGLKIPREGGPYCEDCGWPDEDFGDEE